MENTLHYKILGPVPCPLSKIQNNYRWHLILKVDKKIDPTGEIVNELIRKAEMGVIEFAKPKKIKIMINVDAVSLL